MPFYFVYMRKFVLNIHYKRISWAYYSDVK